MKEIIYLDNLLVNSYLAQIDKGLQSKMIDSSSFGLSEHEDSTKDSSTTASLGISGTGMSVKESQLIKTANTYSKQYAELTETMFHDFALDLLIEKLEENNLFSDSYEDGDSIRTTELFSIYDFKRLKDLSSDDFIDVFDISKSQIEILEEQIKNLKSNKKIPLAQKESRISDLKQQIRLSREANPFNDYKVLNKVGLVGDYVFPNSCLFKIGNNISICDKDNLRINDAILQILSQTPRKITMLGIVIYQVEESYHTLIESITNESAQQALVSTPLIFANAMLESFGIITQGNYFIRPVAIYFD